jgi:membrane protease YdiL (CAAX protease family)
MIGKLFIKDDRLRPPWRVIIYAITVVFVAAVLYDIYDYVTREPYTPQITFSEMIAGEVITAVAVLFVSFFFRHYIDRRSVASLGFALRGPWLRLLGLGILFGAGMQTVANATLWLSGSSHVSGHASLTNDLNLIAVAGVVLLAGALLEELSFRGYVLQNLWEEWGLVPAIVISSLAFAALHLSNPHWREQLVLTLAGLLAFGLWACMSLVWTKSLWLALGAHLAWNLFEGPVYGLPLSGVVMPVPTVFTQSVSGPQWLTGGSFGPEAGLSSLIGLAIGFVVLRALFIKGAFANVFDASEYYARTQPQS